MEGNLQKLKRNRSLLVIFLAGFLFNSFSLFAQTPSVVRNIRLPLWAELDAYPGLFPIDEESAEEMEAESSFGNAGNSGYDENTGNVENTEKEKGVFDFPISQMHKIAPFIIGGMVYGWNFVYVPLDKARGVEEYLEVTEIVSSDVIKGGIKYVSPWISDGNLNCWAEYSRTDSQVQNYNLWASIKNPVIGGIGYASVEKGFEGIEEAAREALKDAIRNYYRKTIKNKPKEINGAVLIRSFPTLGISSGRYVINLDFFLECGKIIEYSVY